MANKDKKYPYTVETNIIKLGVDHYRVLIKKGSGINEQVFSEYVDGKISDARAVKRRGFAELETKKQIAKDKKNTTFFEFSKKWLDFCRKEKLSPATITNYKNNLNLYLLPVLGEYKLCNINREMLDNLFADLKNQKKQSKSKHNDNKKELLSSVSANGAYRVLRNIFNKAVLWDYLEYNPLTKVKCPSSKPKKEKDSYNKEELFLIIKLLINYNKKYGAMFIIDACSGLRRGELNGLHIEKTETEDKDIELYHEYTNDKNETILGGLVFARHSVVYDKELHKVVERDTTKTEKGIRGIPIPYFCVQAIKECIKYRENEIKTLKEKYGEDIAIVPNLFLGKYGGLMHPDTLSHNWSKFRKKYKSLLPDKEVSLHGVRHSFCSYLRNEGKEKISDNEIMDLMGHMDIKTTDGYTHSNREIGGKLLEMYQLCHSEGNR